MRLAVLLILLWLALVDGACRSTAPKDLQSPPETGSRTHALDAVPEPDDDAIRRIRTAEQWHNPYVMVDADGYELILHGQPRTTELLNLVGLEKALLELTPERWPLGRVVAVQENALRRKGDNEKIAVSLDALKRILEAHRVRVDHWPTA